MRPLAIIVHGNARVSFGWGQVDFLVDGTSAADNFGGLFGGEIDSEAGVGENETLAACVRRDDHRFDLAARAPLR
jgi:hypothetical protein